MELKTSICIRKIIWNNYNVNFKLNNIKNILLINI